MAKTTVRSRNRIRMFFLAVCLLLGVAILRLAYIQFIQAEELLPKAIAQWTEDQVVTAKRGTVMDANGETLAMSAGAYMVNVRPKEVDKAANADEVTDAIVTVLGLDRETVHGKVTNTDRSEVLIKRQVTQEDARALELYDLKGIYLSEDTRRYYPTAHFLSQVLGYTNVDGEGQTGLEAYYDRYLSGTDGRVVTQTDKNGAVLPDGEEYRIDAVDGYDLRLTVDYAIQNFAERAAAAAMEEQQASAVTVIVMDPNTGAVLAMVNKPDIDNNDPPRSDIKQLNALSRNRAVTDVYDPGSTFKIITAAAALDSGTATADSTFHCSGSEVVSGQRIRCWRSYAPHGTETLTQGVMNSCNPVFMELALSMGKNTFYSYLNAFGFGQPTGIDFGAEASGIVTNLKYVTDVDLACMSFGQSVSVTPVQLISAVSSAINGGYKVTPHLLASVEDGEGNVIVDNTPEKGERIVSEATSATLRTMLEKTVAEGTGHNAYIPGYAVGGKTGTTQKTVDGKVSSTSHVGSFIGFAPADDPVIAVLVVVDEPTANSHYGSIVAAPYAAEVIESTLNYMGVKKVYKDGETDQPLQVSMPDVTGMTLAEAEQKLREAGLFALFRGDGGTVTATLPAAGEQVNKHNGVLVYMSEDRTDEADLVEVPDLEGMSNVNASMALYKVGLEMNGRGRGYAVDQSVAPGTKVERGTEVTVTFAQDEE